MNKKIKNIKIVTNYGGKGQEEKVIEDLSLLSKEEFKNIIVQMMEMYLGSEEMNKIKKAHKKMNVSTAYIDFLEFLSVVLNKQGSRPVFIANDEELNNYHLACYHLETPEDIEVNQGEDMLEMVEQSNDDFYLIKDDHYNALYLG